MHEKLSLKPNHFIRQGMLIAQQNYQIWLELRRGQRTELPRFLNTLTLILARVASSGLGFLTWLLIARLYNPNEVGIASGVTSAMMLIVQLALVGVGSALISLFVRHNERLVRMLHTAFTIVSSMSLIFAGLFLLLSALAFHELVIVSASPLYILLFLGICLFGTVNVLFDHISIAMRRGDEVLTRNVLFGIITIGGAFVLPSITGASNSTTIVLAWTLAGLGACSLGAIQVWRSALRYLYRPVVDRGLAKDLTMVGLPNYLLTLAERAPNWLIPIAVTELLSPVDNAHWYSVWMMAWVVFIIPISVGQNLFAEVARKPEAIGSAVRHSLRTALILGIGAALSVGLLSHFLLSLLGEGYASAGTVPLRILVIAVLPVTAIQAYYAICRATRRLREATLTGVVSGVISVIIMALAGVAYGLPSMAVVWLVVQSITSLWALWRLRIIGLSD